MRKILITYFSFVIACMIVIVAFITATTYTQLAVAIALYPLLIFFAFKVFPRKYWKCTSKIKKTKIQTPVKPEEFEEAKRENVGISDIDKRAFLKLIGAAGLSLFLFSIFNKKTEGLFSKSLPTSNKIDSIQAQPTDGYKISEIDDNVISYYGYTNKDGAWFITRGDTDTGSFRYARGNFNFPGNWTNRENLKYDYFDHVFKP